MVYWCFLRHGSTTIIPWPRASLSASLRSRAKASIAFKQNSHPLDTGSSFFFVWFLCWFVFLFFFFVFVCGVFFVCFCLFFFCCFVLFCFVLFYQYSTGFFFFMAPELRSEPPFLFLLIPLYRVTGLVMSCRARAGALSKGFLISLKACCCMEVHKKVPVSLVKC